MSLQLSIPVRNARADAIEAAIGASAVMKLYTGNPPADCATADGGTVVATIQLATDWAAAASGGSKSFQGTMQDTSADATGVAQHFRVLDSTATNCGMQGLVSQAYGNSLAVVVGQQLSNANGVYRGTTAGTTAGTGAGPTGTGSGITDGTAVFTYLQAAPELTLSTTAITAGQTVTITALSTTEANA